MASTISTAMVNTFSSNVYHLSQQKDSRVWSLFGRKETVRAEEAYFDRIGTTEAMEKISRNADTTYVDVPYDRRRLTMRDYFWATLVDKEDKLRLIHSPESEQAKAARYAMARKMDDIGVAALLGTVYTGKTGSTPVALPDSQKLVAHNEAGNALDYFNLTTLQELKMKFDAAEVEDENRHILLTSANLNSLLQEDKLTSSDYAAVKALVRGEINSFYGFQFHRYERLPVLTSSITTADFTDGSIGDGAGVIPVGSTRTIAFASSAMIAGIGADATARVTEMPNKHYANQVYMSMTLGAMRMEEVKVVEVLTKA